MTSNLLLAKTIWQTNIEVLEYVILNYLLKRFGKQIKGQAREKENSRHLLKRKRRVALNLVRTGDVILLNATQTDSVVTASLGPVISFSDCIKVGKLKQTLHLHNAAKHESFTNLPNSIYYIFFMPSLRLRL